MLFIIVVTVKSLFLITEYSHFEHQEMSVSV